jgi:hypothetical protein
VPKPGRKPASPDSRQSGHWARPWLEALPPLWINAPAPAGVSLLPHFAPAQGPVLVTAMPVSAPPFLLAPGHLERHLPCAHCLFQTGSPLLVRDASLKVETLRQFGNGVLPIQARLRDSFVLSPLKFPKFGTFSRPPPQTAHFLLYHSIATICFKQQFKMASTGHFQL